MKKAAILFLLAGCFIINGCGRAEEEHPLPSQYQESVTAEDAVQQTEAAEEEAAGKLSAWLVYWDMGQAAQEIAVLGNACDTVSYFEAYFDGDYHVTVPEGFLEACEEIPLSDKKTYLTFVNDVVYGDGKANDLKDTKVLQALFGEEASMTAHIEELIDAAKLSGVDGIEIDYENIREDMELWKKFEVFAELLAERATEEELQLRIVLESMTPFSQLQLPETAEYVVMCYNLHGGAGDIGAKADEDFLKKTVSAAQALGRKMIFAVSAGGFDWWDDGEMVQAVSEQEVNTCIRDYQVTDIKRDPESYAAYFSYVDKVGEEHEVWYADDRTLKQWKAWIFEAGGTDIALWRLGGNEEETLKKLSKNNKKGR